MYLALKVTFCVQVYGAIWLRRYFPVNFFLTIFFTSLGIAVMGYHPGLEDDGIYLSAIQADLNPSLYPHDAAFFQLQMRTSIFPNMMAHFVGVTGMPLAWSELLWQLISIFLIIWGCWSIVSRLFEESTARWAGVAMVAAMFTLPVTGTALLIVDQYLHPRVMAMALIMLAVSRILAGKSWQAVPLLALGFLIHPLMGALGITFCCILALTCFEPFRARLRILRKRLGSYAATSAAAFIPLGWVFATPSKTWLEITRSRHCLHLYQWTWYEWLGVIGPLVLFWLLWRIARKRGETALARFAMAVVIYCVFQQAVAMVILLPQAPAGLSALEPMRYLHLVYIFIALIGGCLLGKYLLKGSVWRWAVFLVAINGGMFVTQRLEFSSSEHLELPGRTSDNPWLQAFAWIRQNTPTDAYFALDPEYLAAPGEDYHSFRAMAERSQLADNIKDTSVATLVPELGEVWKQQAEAQKGWTHFQLADFERLKAEFGVDWVLVSFPQPVGLNCEWHNESLSVCQIP
jgi:hypothetical protein